MEEETRYVQFRSKVVIPCSAMGYPTPNVTWRRGSSGDDIPKTGSIIASDGSKGASTLTIARVLTMDQGVYSCRAVNSGGEDIHYVTVSLSKGNSRIIGIRHEYLCRIGISNSREQKCSPV